MSKRKISNLLAASKWYKKGEKEKKWNLGALINLLGKKNLNVLLVNQLEIEQVIQALETYGTESGQSKEKLSEASIFIRILLSTIVIKTRVNFRTDGVNVSSIRQHSNI